MTWDFLPVHNACLCVPLPTKWPSRWATERLLSKTLCYDHPEPNNNSRKASVQVKASQVAVASASSVTSKLVPGSSHSGSSKKEGKEKGERKSVSPMGSGSDSDAASLVSGRRVQPGERPGAPPTNLGALPPELSGSRQSFRMAMGNPSLIEAEDIE